ncbi:MAG: protein-disulfide reductase DsbD N-terminal domain-containing protein, partial [Campylobacterota bacterium]|nr:protein-disulfide reductase DsbD N-terminal domain-containing protein [Campylobacterota bacterium]
MKYIISLLLLISSVFANNDFLNPEDAFKTSVTKSNENITFKIKLDKTIYLYDEYIVVSIVQPKKIDITKELNIKEPISYDGFIVHFDQLEVDVPLSLIKEKIGDKPFEINLEYQGCSKAGLCYSPMSISYSSAQTPAPKPNTQQEEKITINETDTIAQTLKEGNVLLILATFFGFGLLLALT